MAILANTSLLKDHAFDSYFKRDWACFLEMNDSLESSPSLLREAGKAVLRGKIISFSVYKKRKEKEQQAELEQKNQTAKRHKLPNRKI